MRICMVSDFFYPNTGGVETHIWQLSRHLIEIGHKVVVITHAYDDCVGVKHMTNGLKVYYLNIPIIPRQNIIWPIIFHTFASVRQILLREQINIAHGHSVFSPLAHEVVFHAKSLGIKTVFTDHSLFGQNGYEAFILSNVIKSSLLQCDHIICVSQVGKKNEALNIEKGDQDGTLVPVSVIPNAVDTIAFTPDYTKRDPNKITIVVNSRLVFRKGIDLLASVLPIICDLDPKVCFIISGDGSKRILLENAIKQHNLDSRVTLLGSVPHTHVRDILVKGDIFLNTSIIEAFCMAVVEAASCGLQVVSTNVGGLPEVLPPQLVKLTDPNVESIVAGVQLAIDDLKNKKYVIPDEAHKIIERCYSWRDVAKQTEKVYLTVARDPPTSLKQRIKRYRISHSLLSIVFIVLILMNHLLVTLLEWTSS